MTGLRARPVEVARIPLTVVDAVTSERTDVVVTVDPLAPAQALEEALVAALRPRGRGLWLGEQRLDDQPLGTTGVRAGVVLGVGGPVDHPGPGTGPVVEVLSGRGAGERHPLVDVLSLGPVRVTAGPAGVVAGDAVLRPGEGLDVGDRVIALGRGGPPVRPAVVTRPPRLRARAATVTLQVPRPPALPEGRRLPVVPLLLPVLLGVVMALVSNPLFLLFTLLSPLMALSTWWSDRGQARRTRARLEGEHKEALEALRQEEQRLRAEESARRHHDAPDPDHELGSRLWERRRTDDDFLRLRLGLGEQPPVSYRLSDGEPAPLVVPVGVSLRDVGVLGVVAARPLAHWLVLQAALLHSPRDLSVWLLADPALEDEGWQWVRWLPHLAPGPGQDCAALVGTTVDGVAARVGELVALVAARVAAARDVRGSLENRERADLLVVLDGAQALRAVPGLATVLRDGPSVGVHALCLEEVPESLPEECQAVVVDGVLRRSGEADTAVRLDRATAGDAERRARALAPLRDALDDEARLPSTARLLEVLALDPPTPERVRARAGRTTSAVVGVDADGPVALDLQRDGPHVLVAGTTGAGKSELLQTLVASLAVANRPDAMTFVLVDYKGGAAFRECARLPHTVGMVTDLDGHLVERALASLTAELKRRERQLQDAGAKDIDDLWRAGAVLPRLVIVIDEFASLVEELPDFVRGLVGIAQRGRSLGVHLVLATQRPSGVVSPEIRANTDLRLALRVTDAAESVDVLDAPDAAGIPRSAPGRALARTGPGPLVPFQTARVGGRRPGAASALDVRELPWAEVGLPARRPPVVEVDDESTDLHALVEAVRAAHPGPAPQGPWLPPLPDRVPPALGCFGLEDLPEQQRQQPAVWDGGGHLLVVGAARSGRSTALRAVTRSLVATRSPDDLHVYALDLGSDGLACLAPLPHTGAVVTRHEPERAERLLARLAVEIVRRQGHGGVGDPELLLVLDRWEALEEGQDTVLRLLRDGAAVGLRALISGDRTALLGKLPHAVEDTLLLRLAERSDYALAGLDPRQLPTTIGDGRGFRGGRELQVADVTAADVLSLVLPAAARPPFRVDPLPARITWEAAVGLGGEGFVVGGDELGLLSADLSRGFTVAGPAGSGRSTALLALARSLPRTCAVTPRPSPLAGVDVDGLLAFLEAGPGAVLVDDAELVEGPMADLLIQVSRDGRDSGHSLVVAGTTEDLATVFRGFVADVRRSRTGLLLGVASHLDGELLGVRLPRASVRPGPAGRGLLVRHGAVDVVQVPV